MVLSYELVSLLGQLCIRSLKGASANTDSYAPPGTFPAGNFGIRVSSSAGVSLCHSVQGDCGVWPGGEPPSTLTFPSSCLPGCYLSSSALQAATPAGI